jgi:hypothetical protein
MMSVTLIVSGSYETRADSETFGIQLARLTCKSYSIRFSPKGDE